LHRGHDAGRKSLQAGTSHFLGQNFAKAFDVLFTNKENKQEHVWATSWGVSTRLMGALIMTHSDDHGLVLPPKLAPVQVAIVPIAKNGEQLTAIDGYMSAHAVDALRAKGITVKFDDDDKKKPGWKFAEYEFKGYPVRIAIGPRDMENGTVEVARRDTLEKAGDASSRTSPRRWSTCFKPSRTTFTRRRWPCARNSTQRGQLRGVQGSHRPRRLHPGTLGRHGRDRGIGEGGDQGHDPLHPIGQATPLLGCMVTGKPSARRVSFLPVPTDEQKNASERPEAAIIDPQHGTKSA
jgi:hypothetical protein